MNANVSKETFMRLVALQPELDQIRKEIDARKREARGKARVCANDIWYGYHGEAGFKRRVVRLVGFEAKGAPRELKTMRAYDDAYSYLYARLPNCRACGCIGIEPSERAECF